MLSHFSTYSTDCGMRRCPPYETTKNFLPHAAEFEKKHDITSNHTSEDSLLDIISKGQQSLPAGEHTYLLLVASLKNSLGIKTKQALQQDDKNDHQSLQAGSIQSFLASIGTYSN